MTLPMVVPPAVVRAAATAVPVTVLVLMVVVLGLVGLLPWSSLRG